MPLLVTGCFLFGNQPPPGGDTFRPNPTKVYINDATGFSFPGYLDGFAREKVMFYRPGGDDLSVDYTIWSDPRTNIALMTVYVYPAPDSGPDDTLESHFERCKDEIEKVRQNAHLISEDEIQIRPNKTLQTGKKALFTYTDDFGGRRQTLHSELYLFRYGQRYIMYRVSCPEALEKEMRGPIDLFLNDFTWP